MSTPARKVGSVRDHKPGKLCCYSSVPLVTPLFRAEVDAGLQKVAE